MSYKLKKIVHDLNYLIIIINNLVKIEQGQYDKKH